MINYKDLPTDELIILCRDYDQPEAWDEFFRRYTRLIKRSIIRKLLTNGLIKHVIVGKGKKGEKEVFKYEDDDMVNDIFGEIYINLRVEKELKKLRDVEKINKFLSTLAKNETKDWIRHYFAQKNMPKVEAERNVVHLDSPTDNDAESDPHEIMDLENPFNPPRLAATRLINEKVNRLEIQMKNLSEKQLWVMRLKLIGYIRLDEEEITELSRMTGKTADELSSQLSSLMDSFLEKRAEKEKHLGLASQVLAVLNHLESKLNYMKDNPDISTEKIVEIKTSIERKRKRLAKLTHEANQLVESTSKEVANILGIKNERNVNTEMSRARNKIKKNQKN